MEKAICDVFKDFNGENFEIWACQIFKMDLYKKSNKLDIGINAKSPVVGEIGDHAFAGCTSLKSVGSFTKVMDRSAA